MDDVVRSGAVCDGRCSDRGLESAKVEEALGAIVTVAVDISTAVDAAINGDTVGSDARVAAATSLRGIGTPSTMNNPRGLTIDSISVTFFGGAFGVSRSSVVWLTKFTAVDLFTATSE